jgi:uncharacterized membrane protein YgcG
LLLVVLEVLVGLTMVGLVAVLAASFWKLRLASGNAPARRSSSSDSDSSLDSSPTPSSDSPASSGGGDSGFSGDGGSFGGGGADSSF